MVIRKPRQRGSIYVLTLLTVAAVGSMVIIGVSVRTATSAESAITEQVNTNNEGTLCKSRSKACCVIPTYISPAPISRKLFCPFKHDPNSAV